MRQTEQSGPPGSRGLLVGHFAATVITLPIDRRIIRTWLPTGITFGPEAGGGEHPLFVFLGRQRDVCPVVCGRRWPLPFCLDYAEIIAAVPDLWLERPLRGWDEPVTYLPRLYLNSWFATLIGRGLYRIKKAYARIQHTAETFVATNRHGEPLLTASLEPSGERPLPPPDRRLGRLPWFLQQPIALEGRAGINLSEFRFDLRDVEVTPMRAHLELFPAILSWLPRMETVTGSIGEAEFGAFRFEAPWHLARCPVARGARPESTARQRVTPVCVGE
jgi:hypothetical protein